MRDTIKSIISGVVAGTITVGLAFSFGSSASAGFVDDYFKSYKAVYQSLDNLLSDGINYTQFKDYRIYGDSASSSSSSSGSASSVFVDGVNNVFNSPSYAADVQSLLVSYAKASTNGNGDPVVTEITIPEQLDFTGQCFFSNQSNSYNELFQIHVKFNGYRYKQEFYPDCCIYFSRIDESGVTMSHTIYIDPTYTPVLNTDYTNSNYAGFRFYSRMYIDGAWSIKGIQFRTSSTNDVSYSHERWNADNWWRFDTASTIGNAYGYPYYFTDAATNSATWYTFLKQVEESQGGGFTVPIGFGGAAAGAIINFESLLGGFSFDSLLGGLTVDFESLLGEFTANIGDSLETQYDNLYSNIAEFGEIWQSQNRQNLFELYNYQQPLPPSTGGGVPNDWLTVYPTVTTAWSIEPYNATLPAATLPSIGGYTSAVEDAFTISELSGVAVALGLLSLCVGLIL